VSFYRLTPTRAPSVDVERLCIYKNRERERERVRDRLSPGRTHPAHPAKPFFVLSHSLDLCVCVRLSFSVPSYPPIHTLYRNHRRAHRPFPSPVSIRFPDPGQLPRPHSPLAPLVARRERRIVRVTLFSLSLSYPAVFVNAR